MNRNGFKHFGTKGAKQKRIPRTSLDIGGKSISPSTTASKFSSGSDSKIYTIRKLSNVGLNRIYTEGLSSEKMNDILESIRKIYMRGVDADKLQSIGERYMGIAALSHSAKGSTWEDHKYIKRINGVYYYPDSYEGGRHLSDEQKQNMGDEAIDIEELSESDIEKLADEVIRGNFGNGQERKEALGVHYQTIQDRVNQKLKSGSKGSSSSSSSSSSESSSSKDSKKDSSSSTKKSTSKGVDYDSVYGVYDRQAEREKEKSKKKATSTQKRDKSTRTPTRISEKRR